MHQIEIFPMILFTSENVNHNKLWETSDIKSERIGYEIESGDFWNASLGIIEN